MGKILKTLGWLIGVVVLLVVAAAVILPLVVDPNDYKDEIVAKVREETGRDLKIDGTIGLTVFPWLGFEIGSVELGNAQGFGDQPFALVKRAAVRVKFVPLLSRRVEVDTIGLAGLELNLARLKDGTSNWDDLTAGGAEPPAKQEPPVEAERSAQYGLEALSIGGLDISDARIVWDDRRSGQHFSIEQFNLQSGALISGEPVDLQLGMVLQSREPEVKSDLRMKGVVALDEAAGVVDVSGLRIDLEAAGAALPGGAVKAVLEAGVKAALDGSSLEIKGLKVNADDLSLTGELAGRDLRSGASFSGNLSLAEFNLRKWLVDHAVTVPPMADQQALTRVGAKTVLTAKDGATQLNDLAIRLDDTQINGDASLRGSAVGFKLNIDQIDIDRYLPPADQVGKDGGKPGPASASAAPATGSVDEALLPVETLRGLDLDGVLTIGKLTINRLLAEQVKLTVKGKDGQLMIGQQVERFYQGGYQGKVNLDVRGKVPVTSIEGASSGIQIGALLKDLTGEDRLTGKGRFSANLNTRGNSINAFKRDLGGKLDFRFEEGAVKGINVAQTIREAKARLAGKPVPRSDQPVQTDFSEISGSGVINKGVLRNEDLLAKSPFLRVTGAGDLNLVVETMDYKVNAVIVGSEKGQGGEGLEELKGVNIPVHLTGPFAAPDYKVNWEKILLDSQKDKIKEKIQEKLQKELPPDLQDKLPPDLQDKLKGLFN